METKSVLGRGLRSLIPDKKDMGKGSQVVELPLSLVVPNPHQPRTHFDATELTQLAASIKEQGVLQPILVRRNEDRYEIIAGERRVRACKQLGMLTVPAILKEASEDQSCEMALVENLQRTDLNWVEKAIAYKRYMEEFEMTHEALAQKLGMTRSAVTNTVRLLTLPESIQEKVKTGELSFTNAKLILSLTSTEEQLELMELILTNNMTAQEVDTWLKSQQNRTLTDKEYKLGPTPRARAGGKSIPVRGEGAAGPNAHIVALKESLQERLGTKVNILYKEKTQKGTIMIEYYSLDDLERLLDVFGVR